MPHSIFGWDLPPGCSVSDIPGNRPEDAEWERIIDNLWDEKGNPAHFTKEEFASSAKLYENDSETHIDSMVTKIIDYGMGIGEKTGYGNAEENRHYEIEAIREALETARYALVNKHGQTKTDKAQKP